MDYDFLFIYLFFFLLFYFIYLFGQCIQLRNWKSSYVQGHYNQTNEFGRLLQKEEEEYLLTYNKIFISEFSYSMILHDFYVNIIYQS